MVEIRIEPDSEAIDDFFAGSPLGRQVYDVVAAVVEGLGTATARVTKSQVAFRRRRAFCWLWRPGMYLPHATVEVVVSVALDRHDVSARWKESVEVVRHWMHHLEIRDVRDLDDDVAGWLAEAYDLAG
jgi:hypothetical protein